VNATGYSLENNSMAGHPGTKEDRKMKDLDQLNSVIDQRDTVFFLIDSVRTRLFSTLIGDLKIRTAAYCALDLRMIQYPSRYSASSDE
jgi:hypothetical protein